MHTFEWQLYPQISWIVNQSELLLDNIDITMINLVMSMSLHDCNAWYIKENWLFLLLIIITLHYIIFITLLLFPRFSDENNCCVEMMKSLWLLNTANCLLLTNFIINWLPSGTWCVIIMSCSKAAALQVT